MEFRITNENGRVPVTVLHLGGDLDSSNYLEFQKKADELINAGARHILVDLTNVPFISSAGFRVLHQMFNSLRALHPDANLTDEQVRQGISAGTYHSPHLKLLNLSPGIRRAFELTGFDMYIETYTDLKTAVAAF